MWGSNKKSNVKMLFNILEHWI